MQQLEALVQAAQAEVSRQMQICNACRYCESYCAVFPAMTRRLEFGAADAHYLANLCHNCGACLHACQYAPPHEFAVNVPRAMAEVRRETYTQYAWPRSFGALYRRNGITVAVALAVGLALFMLLLVARRGSFPQQPLAGDFYSVFPHGLLVGIFGAAFGFAVVALAVGVRRFWGDVSPATDSQSGGDVSTAARNAAAREATRDALRLKYLDGGHGEGCNDADDKFTLWRRRWHHFTFYGFMLCFASTCVATIYHYAFGWHAPYALTSLPVVLGTFGGIGLIVGPIGLFALMQGRVSAQTDPQQRTMDEGFIALLLLTSITGLALLVLRDTRWMVSLLAVHLGIVLALFLTLPYGKFAHGVFRCAALFKYAIEKRLPTRLQLGGE
jgi:citrate/tricarballylate utilization protein